MPSWKREDWAVDVLRRAIPPSTRTRRWCDVETLTVAAVQATPSSSTATPRSRRSCGLTKEAAGLGAKLIVFPETFVPTYPDCGARPRGTEPFEG